MTKPLLILSIGVCLGVPFLSGCGQGFQSHYSLGEGRDVIRTRLSPKYQFYELIRPDNGGWKTSEDSQAWAVEKFEKEAGIQVQRVDAYIVEMGDVDYLYFNAADKLVGLRHITP